MLKPVTRKLAISWKLGGEGNLSSLIIERAFNNESFEAIKTI